jgi:hypothetical protein
MTAPCGGATRPPWLDERRGKTTSNPIFFVAQSYFALQQIQIKEPLPKAHWRFGRLLCIDAAGIQNSSRAARALQGFSGRKYA